MSSGKIRALRRHRRVCRRNDRARPPAGAAGEIHHGRSARYDRSGRRPPYPLVRSRSRPLDLDRIWRLRRPEFGGANHRGQGSAARSRPRRLRTGRHAPTRQGPAKPWQDDRRRLGSERERRHFRRQEFLRGGREPAQPGEGPGRTSSLDGRREAGARLRERRQSRQSPSRDCRCRLRCRTRFPIR